MDTARMGTGQIDTRQYTFCSIFRGAAFRGAAVLALAAVAAASPSGGASAAGSDETQRSAPARPANPDYAAGKAAIDAGDYTKAITLMSKVAAAEPQNADAMNYLGYSYRQLGDYPASLAWYQKALAVNPDHRGANEYLGELYLQMGDVAKADAQLAKLDDLCLFGCEEYDDLKAAIATYKAAHPGATSG
ncbi:MAG: tetratricopeptide repeat protein [Rhodospirillales bacterium]|nr:tetratricopeptide repeat protein [Rhodospirillales bacterium]